MENKFFGDDGMLRVIPKKNKFKMEIFNIIIGSFEDRVVYSEREVNNILKEFYSDYAILRRYLVDYGFLSRDSYGIEYMKIGDTENET